MSQLSIHPQEATKTLLKKLSSRRMRSVLEKRFGLKGGGKKTLEAIGKEYKITRERVRQIEADALRSVSRPDNTGELEPLFKGMEEHMGRCGSVMAEGEILTTLADSRAARHINFLLHIGRTFHKLPETDFYHARWTTNKDAASSVEKIMAAAVDELQGIGQPVSLEKMRSLVFNQVQKTSGVMPSEKEVDAYLATSKVIGRNPYGEYGLVFWPTVRPRGVRDKAYIVMEKATQPMHFLEVAQAINKVGWSKKKAHPQTVHNELIKDPRFVLVGRGLYALTKWGYEPGVVRDVMVSVLKQAGCSLPKDEIVRLVSEKRLVKPQTILLNLQNKSLFRRTEEGSYTLV